MIRAPVVDGGVLREAVASMATAPAIRALWRPEDPSDLIGISACPRGCLEIDSVERGDAPVPRLQIECISILGAPGLGSAPVTAVVSYCDGELPTLLDGPLHLHLQPGTLLASARFATGGLLPAVDFDAIKGESFGLSPSLALNIDIRALAERLNGS